MAAQLIHPTALIEAGADLAADVRVGAFAYIGPSVRVGEGCVIHHHATVEGNTRMGCRNEVFPYAFVGGRTQDKKWAGDEAPIHIGDDNIFREFTTVHPATFADKWTRIGSRNLFCSYSHVGHECIVGDDCVLSNNATLGGHVLVGSHVVIGGLTPVHQYCRIGDGAMVGGGSKVIQDVMPNALAEGSPIRHRTINKVGMRRRGYSEDEIQQAARIYKLVIRSGFNRQQAIEALEGGALGNDGQVQEILAFLKASERGLA